MAEQSIACPSCGKKIPLTRAIRAEIEESLRQQFDEELQRAQKEAIRKAEKKVAQELDALRDQIKDQTKDLDAARRNELSMRKRERELERKQQDLELEVARQLGTERARLVAETHERLAEGRRKGTPALRHAAADRGSEA